MAENTLIEWTDATWPVTTGCDYESPGCAHCYAVNASWRLAHNPNPKVSGPYAGTVEKRGDTLRWTGLVKWHPDRLDWPLKWKTPQRVFVGNMSDLFHEDVPDPFIKAVFAVAGIASHHTFQVLTKRADRMARFLSMYSWEDCVNAFCREFPNSVDIGFAVPTWPLPNVHVGVSVEDQKRADERIPHLLKTPAAVRFLSVEPLLGPVEFSDVSRRSDAVKVLGQRALSGIHWIIAGGESGPNARPMHIDWARSIRDQCVAAGVPFFFKQWGEWAPLPEPFRYTPAIGSGNREYVRALDAFARKYGARRLIDDRPEGWDRPMVEDGTCVTDGGLAIGLVGKKVAGRLLDGCEWNEFPTITPSLLE